MQLQGATRTFGNWRFEPVPAHLLRLKWLVAPCEGLARRLVNALLHKRHRLQILHVLRIHAAAAVVDSGCPMCDQMYAAPCKLFITCTRCPMACSMQRANVQCYSFHENNSMPPGLMVQVSAVGATKRLASGALESTNTQVRACPSASTYCTTAACALLLPHTAPTASSCALASSHEGAATNTASTPSAPCHNHTQPSWWWWCIAVNKQRWCIVVNKQ